MYDSVLFDNSANSGGGLAFVTAYRCRIFDNHVLFAGGGSLSADLFNCMVYGNSGGQDGGGCHSGSLVHCTVVNNSAAIDGGGVAFMTGVKNSIVYGNHAFNGPDNYTNGPFDHSCSFPLPVGPGNIAVDPLLVSYRNPALLGSSPCVDAGDTNVMVGTVDVQGDPRRNGAGVDMGADEVATLLAGSIALSIDGPANQVVVGQPIAFEAVITGDVRNVRWRYQTRIIDDRGQVTLQFDEPGLVMITLEAENDESATNATFVLDVVSTFTNYVDLAGSHVPPFTSPATAATNIQAAVDVAAVGGSVLIAPGRYDEGRFRIAGDARNRVVVDRPLRLLGMGASPEDVQVQGELPTTVTGMRGLYLGDGAILENITVLESGVPAFTPLRRHSQSGGGVFCEAGATIRNCVIRDCDQAVRGGGVFGGTIEYSLIKDNFGHGFGGGAAYATLNHCVVSNNYAQSGGGAYYCVLDRCSITSNRGARGVGLAFCTAWHCQITDNESLDVSNNRIAGGALSCTLYDCLVARNSAPDSGGGMVAGAAINCTIVQNSADGFAGGVRDTDVRNSIVYHNHAPVDPNYRDGRFATSCVTPLPAGAGNVHADPQLKDLVAYDYRPSPNSVCVNAGQNEEWMAAAQDVLGHKRVIGGVVDMGAIEAVVDGNLSVWLEGAYIPGASLMRTQLQDQGALPLTSPYAADPISVSALPSNTVDWVLLELREQLDAPAFYSRSAVVRADGRIVSPRPDADTVDFEVNPGSYYIFVKHRNHLPARSIAALSFATDLVFYDFRLAGFANDVQLDPSFHFGMRSGDVDGDGAIQAIDADIHETQLGLSGYLRADANLDGQVDQADEDLFVAGNLGEDSPLGTPETALKPALRVVPDRLTVRESEQVELTGLDGQSVVHWSFVENNSGATLITTSTNTAAYTAGIVNGVVDVIEAWDRDNRLGRTFLNIISSNEVAALGKAVLIAGGKGLDDPVWEVTENMTAKAYQTLRYRGYSRENILYHSFGPDRDVDQDGFMNDIDQPEVTKSDVARLFSSDIAQADRLFVYLADHGSEQAGSGFFRLNSGETISAVELDAWLTDWQDTYNKPVTLLLEYCYSGASLSELDYGGPAERIVIASAAADELAFFMSGGRVSFTEHFFNAVLLGEDVKRAFERARDAMSASSRGNQNAVISDLNAAENEFVGATFVAGKDLPIIGSVLDEQVVNNAQSVVMFVDDIASVYDLERVWVSITPPNYTIDTTTGIPVIEQIERDLLLNPLTGRYELQFDGLSQSGTYLLNFFAQDIWGSVSPPRSSAVFQQGYTEKCILVAGAGDADVDDQTIRDICRNIYTTLESRLFNSGTIYYLDQRGNDDLNGDGTNDVDGVASEANLRTALQNFAADAEKLTVYLVGGTRAGRFELSAGQSLEPSLLSSVVDSYQSTDRDLMLLLDFSGAGIYLDSLFPPQGRRRVVVASADRDRRAVLTRDLSFSSVLMSHVFNGETLGVGLRRVRKEIRRASGNVRQKVLVNDNGNIIANEKNVDGLVADTLFIGNAFVTGEDIPNIGYVNAPATLTNGTAITLFADAVTDVDGISNVWVEITSPENYLGAVVSTSFLAQVSGNRYELDYMGFNLAGLYSLSFFAADNLGFVSPGVQTTVLQTETNLLAIVPGAVPDGFESDNVATNATLTDLPAFQYHTLHTSSDCDWVRFFAESNVVYDIETIHQDLFIDTRIEIYREGADGTLTLVDEVDEFGRDEGELAGLDFPETGFYQVRVCQAFDPEYQPGGLLVGDLRACRFSRGEYLCLGRDQQCSHLGGDG